MKSFLQELIEHFNNNGITCHIEKTNFKGSNEPVLYICINVKLEDRMGNIKLRLDKFSESFGKMLLMNNLSLDGAVKEQYIILKRLAESGMVKLMDEVLIDKNKLIGE